ncbi:MAG: hypothetical protein HYX53_05830 [Chloroflexi bacterium]|nr:hypothetical protein [Chloroflexota bacterium]
MRGEQPIRWILGREQRPHFVRKRRAQPEEVIAVGEFLLTATPEFLVVIVAGEVELKAGRLEPPPNGLAHVLSHLEHLERAKAVQVREGYLAHQLFDRSFPRNPAAEHGRLDVLKLSEEFVPKDVIGLGEVSKRGSLGRRAVRIDGESPFQNLGD